MPGDLTRTIPVQVFDNAYYTGKTVNFSIEELGKSSANVILGSPLTATVSITDDEVPVTAKFDPGSYTESESQGWVTATVVLNATAPQDVFIDYYTLDGSATDGTDYKYSSGTLAFKPGDLSKTIPVQIFDNGYYTGDTLDFTIELSNPSANATLGSPSTATVFITDDEEGAAKVELDFKNTTGTYSKKGPKAFIVNVNNFDSGEAEKYTHIDNKINGAADKTRLQKSELVIKKAVGFPEKGKVVLKVSEGGGLPGDTAKNKIRIFDDADVGQIGPPAVDGGPDKDSYEIPEAKIKGGDLSYLVECVNHGNIKIELTMYNAGGAAIAKDWVNAVLVVDRMPGDADNAIRFRVRGKVGAKDIDGIEAKIETQQPKLDYVNSIRTFSGSVVWVGAQIGDQPKYWIQTGLAIFRDKTKKLDEVEKGFYIEVIWDPNQPRIFRLDSKDWPASGVYQIRVTDATIGKVEASLDGKVPIDFSITKDIFKTLKMDQYQISSELFHSNDQNPGASAKKLCVISEASYYDKGVKKNTAFTANSVGVLDWDTRGFQFYTGYSHEWGYSNVGATGWKMWDKVVEY